MERAGFATGVAALQDEIPSLLDGTEPEVGQQPPGEPGVERAAHSRVEPLRPVMCSPAGPLSESRPGHAAHSQVEP